MKKPSKEKVEQYRREFSEQETRCNKLEKNKALFKDRNKREVVLFL